MFWIVICVLILCLIDSRQPKEYRNCPSCILFGAAVGCALYVSIGVLIGLAATKEYTEDSVKELYALEDGSGSRGSFFLASGYVDEEPVIKYITDGEFGKEIKSVETEDCYINETDGDVYLKIMKPRFKHGWVYLFSFYVGCDKHIFYIPSGSVINQYNIDLQ